MKNKMLAVVFSAALLAVGQVFAENEEATASLVFVNAKHDALDEKIDTLQTKVVTDLAAAAKEFDGKLNEFDTKLTRKIDTLKAELDKVTSANENGVISRTWETTKNVTGNAWTTTKNVTGNAWTRTKDVAGNVWTTTESKFNDGVDFVGTNWTANTYYVRPVTYTATGLALLAVVYKVGKKVLDKMNQLEEEERANQDNQ